MMSAVVKGVAASREVTSTNKVFIMHGSGGVYREQREMRVSVSVVGGGSLSLHVVYTSCIAHALYIPGKPGRSDQLLTMVVPHS